MKGLLVFILTLNFSMAPAMAANSCRELFEFERTSAEIEANEVIAQEISEDVRVQAEVLLAKKGLSGVQLRGYAILIASMVGSAALTTYVGTHLDSNLKFLSTFLVPFTTLGIYILGAPILEPLSSRIRQIAFGVRKDSALTNLGSYPQLDATWLRTQEQYSLNAQMSRNVISQFIVSIKQNFYEAHRAYSSDNKNFSADQVAEAAFRLKVLFKDIKPNDISVAAAVNTAFTNHIVIDSTFVSLVWNKLKTLDPHFESPESREYYRLTLQSWLKINTSQVPD